MSTRNGVIIRYKLLNPAAQPPAYKTAGASGMDLCSTIDVTIYPGGSVRVPLGICVEIPTGYEGQLRPRSSLNVKGVLSHFGTIDSDYRGEISAVLTNLAAEPFFVLPGDRIAQLVIAPVERVEIVAAEELTETARGAGGFGSTGTR